MIRLRIDREIDIPNYDCTGLIWHEKGIPVGRVIIEHQRKIDAKGYHLLEEDYTWEPVETVDV